MARMCILRIAISPAWKSGFFSGFGWWTIPLYPTSGTLSVMLNSIYAAQHPHSFTYRGWEVATSGNSLAHAVLRGAVNKHGNSLPNYHYEDLNLLLEMYQKENLLNPACVIDANHSNSGKQYLQQGGIFESISSAGISEDFLKAGL